MKYKAEVERLNREIDRLHDIMARKDEETLSLHSLRCLRLSGWPIKPDSTSKRRRCGVCLGKGTISGRKRRAGVSVCLSCNGSGVYQDEC